MELESIYSDYSLEQTEFFPKTTDNRTMAATKKQRVPKIEDPFPGDYELIMRKREIKENYNQGLETSGAFFSLNHVKRKNQVTDHQGSDYFIGCMVVTLTTTDGQ
ncbi:uncharacterized protein LOC143235098 [Tachypleus tridentatus]|uniref:uncharacterized protein LOC143235098 n=1 Tax=Tachypleus tridentatus TaxID=6853 RepID=UPI003FCFD2BD